MKYTRTTVLACVLGITSGCATLNESECRSGDWQTLGTKDGRKGYAAERIERHQAACAKYGIAADLSAYQSGREAGLAEYCRPRNGFNVGLSGYTYGDVCPSDVETAFLEAYRDGRELLELESRVKEVETSLQSARSELESAKGALASANDTTPERRAQGQADAKRLAADVERLKGQIGSLKDDLEWFQQRRDSYRESVLRKY